MPSHLPSPLTKIQWAETAPGFAVVTCGSSTGCQKSPVLSRVDRHRPLANHSTAFPASDQWTASSLSRFYSAPPRSLAHAQASQQDTCPAHRTQPLHCFFHPPLSGSDIKFLTTWQTPDTTHQPPRSASCCFRNLVYYLYSAPCPLNRFLLSAIICSVYAL